MHNKVLSRACESIYGFQFIHTSRSCTRTTDMINSGFLDLKDWEEKTLSMATYYLYVLN